LAPENFRADTTGVYRGDICHKGVVYPGEHQAIVSRELWRSPAKNK